MKKTKLMLGVLVAILFSQTTFAQELYQIPEGAQTRVSSMENLNGLKGRGGITNHGGKGSAYTTLKAGATQELLNVSGPGIIQRLWLTIQDRSPEMLRGMRLRMYWDNAAVPAVDVPLGDFFCLGLGQEKAFENALFSTAEGRSYNCYIPMPFTKAARITLTNTTGKDQSMLFFDVDFLRLAKTDSKALYFHASFSRQDGLPIGQPVDLLSKVTGKGRFLGVSVGLNVNPVYGDTWWGEGEVKMYLDGDQQHPTICGTGAEDYIGSGWGEGVFAGRYQGCLLADGKNGRFSFYRFHIPDVIVFNHDFHAVIEQLGGGFAPVVKGLIKKGVALKPVNITNGDKFTGLLDSKDPAGDLANANDNDWVCFNRSDDYAVTSYYYLDRP